MAEDFNARAELDVSINGIRELINQLEDLKDAGAGADEIQKALSKTADRLQGDFDRLSKAAQGLGSSARNLKNDLGTGDEAPGEWALLKKRVEEAETAYKQLAVAAAAAGEATPDMAKFMSGQGVTAEDLRRYRQGRDSSLLGDEAKETKAAADRETAIKKQAAKDADDYVRDLDEKATTAAKAQAKSEADQKKQVEQEAADFARKLDEEATARAKRNAKELADYKKAMEEGDAPDTSKSLVLGAPRTEAQGNLKQMGVADWDKQMANVGKTTASAAATAEASLPRLRYALYDVASSAAVTSAALTGLGVASVAAFASMESSFTNVERTLDNVNSEGVNKLRADLVALTEEIPLTFGSITEIATLGNQLGIAASDIAQFTETTAKFSAVTGLTAEASAQAFGSLGELLNVQARDYEALGSSIALVGRKSVATEAEIVAMTTRLSASATNAGFTAQQVIALSGAFASLRIAPERAQGVMEVYFNRLNTAIAEGGPRLEAFAKIAGTTAMGVEDLARKDPTALFQRLAVGLGEMDSIAQTGALEQLGLQGIRAGEVFGRVSGNVDVFNAALQDANRGWVDGTELGDQYAKVVDDLASRWQIFLNALQTAGAAVGAVLAGPLGKVLEIVTGLIQGFTEFANNPVGQVFLGLAAVAGVFVAGLAGLVSVLALSGAGLFAMRTALAELALASGGATVGARGLMGALFGVGGAAGAATGAFRVLRLAMFATGIGAVVALAGSLVGVLTSLGSSAGETSEETKQLGDALNRAIATDTVQYYKDSSTAIATYSRDIKTAGSETKTTAEVAEAYANGQTLVGDAVSDTTAKISEQTVALGAQADAFFRNQLAQNEAFQKIASDPDLRASAEAAGFSIGELIASGMQNQGGFRAYLEELRAEAQAIWNERGTSGDGAEATDQAAALIKVVDSLSEYADAMDAARVAADDEAAAVEWAGAKISEMGAEVEEATGNLWEHLQAALQLENTMYSLGSSIGENASMWDVFSEGGRENLGALYGYMDLIAERTMNMGGSNAAVASEFAALYNALIQGGAATANQILFLKSTVESLAGTTFARVVPAKRDFSNLFSGIAAGSAKAAKALGGGGGGKSIKKEIRTLVDYAKDLEGIFKRAFDIRFGGTEGLDTITSGWQKISEAANDAREAAEEHARTLAEMGADREVKKYWLTVAENYKDELRAGKLRAELAELDADAAKEKKDLTAEQEKASMSLVGNSAAAIDNRAALLGLVGDYQDYLGALAASGMSQEDLQRESQRLRGEFVQQATQMGFNRVEVEKYAASFDDMALAIERVPRNITVTANTNPALQALAEFVAKAEKAGSDAGGAFGGGFSNAADPLEIPEPTPREDWWELGYRNGRRIRGGIIDGIGVLQIGDGGYKSSGGRDRIFASDPNGWKTGGYTGNGGVGDVAGVVHGKEYVMSAPAVRTLGVNGMNFMHQMLKSGRIPTMGGGTSSVVDLSAASLNHLAQAIIAANPSIVLTGSQLANSVGAHNVTRNSRGAA